MNSPSDTAVRAVRGHLVANIAVKIAGARPVHVRNVGRVNGPPNPFIICPPESEWMQASSRTRSRFVGPNGWTLNGCDPPDVEPVLSGRPFICPLEWMQVSEAEKVVAELESGDGDGTCAVSPNAPS
jgi:hypothetical protein